MSPGNHISGIYKITNAQTKESYIGSSKNVYSRLYDHMVDLARGYHINKLMQLSWNEHGAQAFTFSVLEEVTVDNLTDREVFWIKKMRAVEDGFNLKSDQEKRRSFMKIDQETKELLEDLDIGSINVTLEMLLKLYKSKQGNNKHHGQ